MNTQTKILATAVFLTFTTQSFVASAASKFVQNPTITIKAGNKTGLQEVYSWDANCRTVRVSVSPYSTSRGKVFVVSDQFKISREQSRQCAGKTVSGYRVVFKALRKGSTVAKYRIKSKALPYTYVVSREMLIK